MVFEYFRKGPYLDVEDIENPPPGAKHVMAELLNGMEDAHVEAFKRLNGHLSETALNDTFATKAELAGAAIFEPDPEYPGFYLVPDGGSVVEDPENPGYYLIGA